MTNYSIEYKARGTYTVIPNINRALRELLPGEFKVYAAICNYARDKHRPGLTYASQRFLGDATGYTRQQVNRSIKVLVSKGYISSTPKLLYGVKRGNDYQILQIEEPIGTAPTSPAATTEEDVVDLGY